MTQNISNIFRRILIALAGGLLCASSLWASSLSPAIVTNDLNNPHKGFMLWGTDYADGPSPNYYGATIYHIYMPWREVETADQVFDWGQFETNHLLPILVDHSNATFVLRPVADYPDGENSGITLFYTGEKERDFPSFLTNASLSIPSYPYASCDGDGPGQTPDWNHPTMITQCVQFVEAMGARYDGDPRITAVQVGLLGLWGEWHQSGCETYAPSNAVKAAVRDAYDTAFTNTPLQTRYPRDPDAVGVEFGFHEDYFPSFTAQCLYGFPDCSDDGDWSLYYCLQNITPASTNNWQSNPISGESPTTAQKSTWSNDVDDVMTVLRDYHFSFLGPAGGHQRSGNAANLNPMKRLLGYNIHISQADWPATAYLDHTFPITLVLTNSGAAPCYHSFPVEVALCDATGTPQWQSNFDFDLRELTPQLVFSKEESFTVLNVTTGVYSMRIGILDPRTDEPGVRIQSAGEDAQYRIEIGTIEVLDVWATDSDGDGMTDGWEFQHFGGFTNALPDSDPDEDGYSNAQEHIADTNPDGSNSYPRVSLVVTDGSNPVVTWAASTARLYQIHRADDLVISNWILHELPLGSDAWTDTNPPPPTNRYYRISPRLP